jgi:S-DNA-T family DNA segregation ATPase FtsK/SpoIIIE
MLFTSTQSPKPLRVQSPWIDERSISRWIDYLVNMFGEPIYTDIDDQSDAPSGFEESGGFDDALLDEAVKIVISSGIASASGLQKRLRVGYPRAGRLVDMMETAGIIGPADGAHAREILVDEEDAAEILERLRQGN